jgi:hypothetical protein
MARAAGKKLFAQVAQAVEDMRTWVQDDIAEGGDLKMNFEDLCELSNQLLSLAKDITSLAVLVTRAAQEQHNQRKLGHKDHPGRRS